MPETETSHQCANQALFLKSVTPIQSAWIAFGTMFPMVVLQCLIILVITACGGKPVTQRWRRFVGATLLLLLEAALALVLNLAFMHMQYCGPTSPTPATIGILSIWAGDIATLTALIAWVYGAVALVEAWKKERQTLSDDPGNEARPLQLSSGDSRSLRDSFHSDVALPRSGQEVLPSAIIRRDESPQSLAVKTKDTNEQVPGQDGSQACDRQHQQNDRNQPRPPRKGVRPGTRILPRAQSTLVIAEAFSGPLVITQEPEDPQKPGHTDTPQSWSASSTDGTNSTDGTDSTHNTDSTDSTRARKDASELSLCIDRVNQQWEGSEDERVFPMSF
ncbi:Oxygen-dependent coproporphyrinogen-III oxidase [Venturia nashicola]|uniref:Oxygen-dependent coproporphyrinogen-III oxidase n=1 Tax=Venturia nashicola TaxID=86259 RepID=A0A4Z1NM94_9PEZI|nr:Oxygen-dependent coproporphyrinogen-III oxidase [Venturia nashicola]